MTDWEEEDVNSLGGELIETGLATPDPYGHLTLNPALCPYLRGQMDAAQGSALTVRWADAMRKYTEYLRAAEQSARPTRCDADGAGAAEPFCAARAGNARGGCGSND
jgi:hypothetical protein